jgi:DNA polymerase zeta
MKTVFQPYESHLQYLLQWMCDYNLYGCGYINCGKVKFRAPIPDCEEIDGTVHLWHNQSILPQMISEEGSFQRQSHCSLEVDICVQDILNRRDVEPRPIHHDFTEVTHPLASDVKLVPSMAGLWDDEARRRRAANPDADLGSSPFPQDALVSMSAEPRSSQKSGWIHEEEYMEKVDALIVDEKAKIDGREISFNSFAQRDPVEEISRSVFDSVEDFYPSNIGQKQMQSHEWYQTSSESAEGLDRADVEVDEVNIFSMEEDAQYGSDEELAEELDLLSQRNREDQPKKPKEGDAAIPNSDQYRSPTDGCINWTTTSTNTFDSNRPADSDGLAQLGVRDVNDFSHIDEDDFDILPEHASDIASARKAAMRSMRESVAISPNKRKKIFHIESSTYFSEVAVARVAENMEEKVQSFTQQVEFNNGSGTVRAGKSSISSTTPPSLLPNQQHPSRLTGMLKSTSANSASYSRTLPFPVVKDPSDPETIQRLSQRSDSTQKSLKVLTDEGISSDSLGIGTKSQLSSEPNSNATASSSMRETNVQNKLLVVAKNIHSYFSIPANAHFFLFKSTPPDSASILSTIEDFGLPQVIYRDPYYSNESDVPDRPREYAGREFKLESDTAIYLPEFDAMGSFNPAIEKTRSRFDKAREEKAFQYKKRACRLRGWEISEAPPCRGEVDEWLERGGLPAETSEVGINMEYSGKRDLSQIEGPTQKNRHGFKYSQKQETTSVRHETQYMSIMSLEIHVNTRGKLAPNPEEDEVSCIFWCLQSDQEGLESDEGAHMGIIVLSSEGDLAKKISKQVVVRVEEESTELDLINRVVDIVRMYDPDILAGYEVHRGSWGYLMERAGHKYDYNLSEELSRTISQSNSRFKLDITGWGLSHGQAIAVTGRHMLNIWRMIQSELHLLQYTMENVAFHLLHRRIPHYSHRDLTAWYKSGKGRDLKKCIDYYISRVQLNLEILDRNELIPRTSEQARILGVDFFSVISRGSQFKVESIMFRIAKPENFILPSPSKKQVGGQNALECLPLVMEPQSAFYTSPVLVLDFQSLYPSIMIAHNYCYSTYLGRVVSWRGQEKMGFTDYNREPGLLELFKGRINSKLHYGLFYV